jgi:hypothetical protein
MSSPKKEFSTYSYEENLPFLLHGNVNTPKNGSLRISSLRKHNIRENSYYYTTSIDLVQLKSALS